MKDHMAEGSSRPGTRNAALMAVPLAVVLFLAARLFLPMRFAENDDVLIMMLVSGAYSGQPDALTVFQNIYLSSSLASLYERWPQVPWYPSMLLATICLSVAILVVFVRRQTSGWKDSRFLLLMPIVIVSMITTVEMQYTTVAGLAAAVGLFAMASARSVGGLAAGCLLLVFGCLLRFEAGLLATIVLAAPYLLSARVRGRLVSGLTALALTIGISALLDTASNRNMREIAPEYMAFNALRGEINDNGVAALDKAELPEGISENDYELFRRFFADSAEFSLEDLLEIRAEMDENFGELTLQDFIGAASELIRRPVTGFALLLPFLFALTAIERGRFLTNYAMFGLVLASFWAIEVTAILKDRVAYIALLACLVGLILTHSTSRNAAAEWLRVACIGALCVVFGNSLIGKLLESQRLRSFAQSQISATEDWSGNVIVYRAHLCVECAPIFSDDLAPLRGRIGFAGWLVNHPANAGIFPDHSALLEPQNALFHYPGFDEEIVTRLLNALEENHDASVEPKILSTNDAAELVRFGEP